jgi:prophage DNA circulation protein
MILTDERLKELRQIANAIENEAMTNYLDTIEALQDKIEAFTEDMYRITETVERLQGEVERYKVEAETLYNFIKHNPIGVEGSDYETQRDNILDAFSKE